MRSIDHSPQSIALALGSDTALPLAAGGMTPAFLERARSMPAALQHGVVGLKNDVRIRKARDSTIRTPVVTAQNNG
jgi:hypothetical protein